MSYGYILSFIYSSRFTTECKDCVSAYKHKTAARNCGINTRQTKKLEDIEKTLKLFY